MYRISKEFAWSSSHQLDGLPPDHQCARLHGHNYVLRYEVQAPHLDAVGFVIDYGDLAPVKALVDDQLDHRHLNDVLDFNPTAERMAEWLHRQSVGLLRHKLRAGWIVAVHLSETPKTWASYERQLHAADLLP